MKLSVVELKTLMEMEKILVTTIFSFSYDVFKLKALSLGLQKLSSCVNSVTNNKILDLTKLKAFADDKINVTQTLKFTLGRVENIVGIGENAGYQHFLLFLQCFQKATFSGSLKEGIVW